MKQSDSATSLTNLVVCDTACYFCNEVGDLEAGKPLIDMKKFLNCDCRLTAHSNCWLRYLSSGMETPVMCPLCKTSIAGWKVKEASEAVHDQHIKRNACITKTRCYRVLCSIILVGIIVAVVLLCLRVSGKI
ncbi:MAG: hypothetical protein EBY22_11695 [Gammaproteobacteria bacterium]|nr:hypothetical protein [Gammaproteobacteria bacterium]